MNSVVSSDDVKCIIQRYYSKLHPEYSVCVKVEDRIAVGAHSRHFYCHVRILEDSKCLKEDNIFVKHGKEEEFFNLQKVRAYYDNSGKVPRTPKAIYYDKGQSLLLMERIDGAGLLIFLLVSLMPVIRIIRADDVKCKLKECAEWLAEFHNMTYLCTGDAISAELAVAKERLKSLPYFSDPDKSRIADYLSTDAASIKDIPIALTNRDFSPRNVVFAKDGGIMVVDWESILEKNIYYSIVYFLTNLESRARHIFYSSRYIDRLKQEFFDAYAEKSRFTVDYKTLKSIKKLYYIEYMYEYCTKTGVFEEWKRSTHAMDSFIKRKIVPQLGA